MSRKSDIVVQVLGNEILIYDLTENKAFSLNETSMMIWQLCDGNKTISDIARNLSGKFDSPITEDFVWLALEQFKKDNLLENASEVSTDFGGLSRREVIRKVGFASLVALPVVASLVAPTAIHAQSAAAGCFGNNNLNQSANGCTCNSASDCKSTCCGSGLVCVTTKSVANGGACNAACECAGGCCAGGTCFTAKAFPAGTACASTCQCVNSCVNGACT
ncbi:MAG: PqqD family protein [Pyrinomonadaceae bacterium]